MLRSPSHTGQSNALTKRDVDAVELLRKVKLTKNWIDADGVRTRAQPSSATTSRIPSRSDSEWASVEEFIFENRNAFAGVSLLPEGGDLDYPQAPFCEVLSDDEIVAIYGVGALFASGLIVDGLQAFDDNLWAACDCVLGRGENLEAPTAKIYPKRVYEAIESVREAKLDWLRRAHKFAKNYFGGDTLKMTRCLKRIDACKLWEDLNRTNTPVDYTLLLSARTTRPSRRPSLAPAARELI